MAVKVGQLAEHPDVCDGIHGENAVLDRLEEFIEVLAAVKKMKDQVAILSVLVSHKRDLEVLVIFPVGEDILREYDDFQDGSNFELVKDV
jgi:hypothetical protein